MKSHEFIRQGEEREQAGTLFTPDSPSGAAVLMLHGYMSDRLGYAEYAEALAGVDVTSMTIDLPSHGQSSGDRTTLTLRDYMHDVTEAYDELRDTDGVDPSRIGVMGASFGGYFTALLASKRDPQSLLLRAPAIYEDSQFDRSRESIDATEMNEFRVSLANRIPENMALRAIREFGGEVMIVESGKDDSILPIVPRTYAEVAQKGMHVVIMDANHSLRGQHRETFKQILAGWASRL